MSQMAVASLSQPPPRVGEFHRIVRVMFARKIVIFGAVIVALLLIVAAFAPWIAPYNPYQTDLTQSLQPPSQAHWLGTDSLGRDTLSRIIFGSRTSLLVGIFSIFIAASIGLMLGLLAGYYSGAPNIIIMRIIDSLMAVPPMLLALVLATVLGGGLTNTIVAIGIGLTSIYARLMCGQVLTVRENDYVLAARAGGAGNSSIMARHILPNCFPPLIVLVTMQMGMAILLEAGLSFLGIGIAPPGAAWGAMVNSGYKYLLDLPVLSFAPGIAIMLTVFAFNMLGDGLRDALDPRLRGTV